MPTPITNVETLGTRKVSFIKTVSSTNPGTGMRTLVPKRMIREEAQPLLNAEEAAQLKDFKWSPTSAGLLKQGLPPFMVIVNGRRFFADAIPTGGNPQEQPELPPPTPEEPVFDLPSGIDSHIAPLIIGAGYDSAEKVIGAGRAGLVLIKGIGPATANTLIDLCSDHIVKKGTQ